MNAPFYINLSLSVPLIRLMFFIYIYIKKQRESNISVRTALLIPDPYLLYIFRK